jgi:hypothetical protein
LTAAGCTWRGKGVVQDTPDIYGEVHMSKADSRAWLNKRHAKCLDRIAELKAKAVRTQDEKDLLDDYITSAQFFERELEQL